MPCITLSSGKTVCYGDNKYPNGGEVDLKLNRVKPVEDEKDVSLDGGFHGNLFRSVGAHGSLNYGPLRTSGNIDFSGYNPKNYNPSLNSNVNMQLQASPRVGVNANLNYNYNKEAGSNFSPGVGVNYQVNPNLNIGAQYNSGAPSFSISKRFAVGGETTDDNKPAFEGTADAVNINSGTKKRIDRVMPWEAPLKPGAWGGLDMRGMRSVTPDQQTAMDFATNQAEKNKIGKFYMDGTNYRLSNSDELEQQRLLESDTVMGASARAWKNTANNSPIMKAYQEGTGDAAKFVLGTAAGIAAAPAVAAGLGAIGTSAAAATSAPTVFSGAGNLLNAGFTGYEMYNAGKYGANAINDLAEGNLKNAGMNSLKAGTYALGAANAPLLQQAIGNATVEGISGYKETGDLGKAVVRGVGAGLTQKVLGDKGHHLHLNHSANEILSKYPTNALFKSATTPSTTPGRVLAGNASLESNIDSNTPYIPSVVESTKIAQVPQKTYGGKNIKTMDTNKLKAQLAAMQDEINRTAEQYGLGGHLQQMMNGGEIHHLPVMPYGFAEEGLQVPTAPSAGWSRSPMGSYSGFIENEARLSQPRPRNAFGGPISNPGYNAGDAARIAREAGRRGYGFEPGFGSGANPNMDEASRMARGSGYSGFIEHEAGLSKNKNLNVAESIVDAMKYYGDEASFYHRKKLASAYGIPDYSGTAEQNKKLLKLYVADKQKEEGMQQPPSGESQSTPSNLWNDPNAKFGQYTIMKGNDGMEVSQPPQRTVYNNPATSSGDALQRASNYYTETGSRQTPTGGTASFTTEADLVRQMEMEQRGQQRKLQQLNQATSIVDAMRMMGDDPSFANRKKMAQSMGIKNYTGTSAQNMELLKSYYHSKATQSQNQTPDYVTDPEISELTGRPAMEYRTDNYQNTETWDSEPGVRGQFVTEQDEANRGSLDNMMRTLSQSPNFRYGGLAYVDGGEGDEELPNTGAMMMNDRATASAMPDPNRTRTLDDIPARENSPATINMPAPSKIPMIDENMTMIDYFRSHGFDPSYANRKEMFSTIMPGYKGTYDQNMELLKKIKNGDINLHDLKKKGGSRSSQPTDGGSRGPESYLRNFNPNTDRPLEDKLGPIPTPAPANPYANFPGGQAPNYSSWATGAAEALYPERLALVPGGAFGTIGKGLVKVGGRFVPAIAAGTEMIGANAVRTLSPAVAKLAEKGAQSAAKQAAKAALGEGAKQVVKKGTAAAAKAATKAGAKAASKVAPKVANEVSRRGASGFAQYAGKPGMHMYYYSGGEIENDPHIMELYGFENGGQSMQIPVAPYGYNQQGGMNYEDGGQMPMDVAVSRFKAAGRDKGLSGGELQMYVEKMKSKYNYQKGGVVKEQELGNYEVGMYGSGGIMYNGTKFPGYNKAVNTAPGDKFKKQMLLEKGGKIKLVKFGHR